MTYKLRISLSAEIAFLKQLVNDLPTSAMLTRMSFEKRLKKVEAELASLPPPGRDPVTARLTFDGKPVVASHGIAADFAGKAVGRFVDAVSAVAASLRAPLSPMGPIPGREQSQLLITGTAIGSFGFELQEARPDEGAGDAPTVATQALAQTQALLEGTLSKDDELLADAAARLDPRAIDKLREFVQCLADNEAVCSLLVGQRLVEFSNVDQVRRSIMRLGCDNLQERDLTLEGRFIGILPMKRTFEFELTAKDADDVISGQVGLGITEVSTLIDGLGVRASADFHVVRIGSGKPRYTLTSPPRWAETS